MLAAASVAGPLDPVPDEVNANTSTQTGTAADDVASEAGVGTEQEVGASQDEVVQYGLREEPADVDGSEGSATVGGAYGTPEHTVGAGPAAEAGQAATDVSLVVSFSTQSHVGQIVSTGQEYSPYYWDAQDVWDGVPDGRLQVGVDAENTDDPPATTEGATITAAPSLNPYYASTAPFTEDPSAHPGGPGSNPPQPVDAGSSDGAEDGSGTASTQSTKASPGLTDVVGIDNRAEAVAAAAVTSIPLLAWFLYHRIEGHDVLENETRKAIYDEVCREPGLGVKELAETADVSYSTASYHLERLEEADMVVSSKRGKKLCYFQNGGTYTEDERELLKVLRNEEAMRVFMDIHEHPGTYRTRIADRLDVSTTTVNWHLDGLVEAGLVDENRDGRTAHLYVDQERLDDRVRPLLDKTADDEAVDAPAPMTQLRSRLDAPATA